MIAITPWHWAGFILFVLLCIAVDMGAFQRRSHPVTFREALGWSVGWFALAQLFALLLVHVRNQEEATEFVTGYLLELSLSLDNILVIALILAAFRVPMEHQRRVLVCGIVGALVMRGIMIGVGAALVQRFHWVLYGFGVFLFYAGGRMLFSQTEVFDPETNWVVRGVRRLFPITPALDGGKFFTRLNGQRALTPLMLVVLLVEATDLLFALDSVPAVFAVTQKAFIVFTSNVFAVLGLRSLYFLLADAIGRFRYLKAGLSVVLVFVGAKMLLSPQDAPPRWYQVEIPTVLSLLIIAVIIVGAITYSLLVTRHRRPNRDIS
jgi:tellurite resistance protein TerC